MENAIDAYDCFPWDFFWGVMDGKAKVQFPCFFPVLFFGLYHNCISAYRVAYKCCSAGEYPGDRGRPYDMGGYMVPGSSKRRASSLA